MLLITLDEHGACYDPVPPPKETPPCAADDADDMGFTFNRLGCRVPAIAVSACARRGTIIHDEVHRGSVIAKLNKQHGLKPLTDRGDLANDMSKEPQTGRACIQTAAAARRRAARSAEEFLSPERRH